MEKDFQNLGTILSEELFQQRKIKKEILLKIFFNQRY
jgi:hypothetical protein